MPTETIIIIVLALAVGSFIRGITGIGLPLIAIPVMAGFIGVQNAVIIMVVPNIFLNSWLLWTYRQHRVALPNIPFLIIASVIGVGLGSWALSTVSENILIIIMIVCLGLYLLKLTTKTDLKVPPAVSRFVSPVVVFIAGLIQGATGVSGPVAAPWAHSLKLPPQGYVFALSLLFIVFAIIQSLTYAWFGTLTLERIQFGLLSCLPVAVVLPASIYVARRIGKRQFDVLIITMLVLVEIRLIFKVLG